METLQIRVPKEILKKVDEIIKQGYFQSRSELLRDALLDYIRRGNFYGMGPLMVGPFTEPQMKLLENTPIESLEPSQKTIDLLKKQLKDFRFD